MRRGNRARLAGRLATGSGALALILLLAAPPLARVGPVAHAGRTSCTGWSDEYVPPPTIRVFRTAGPARGSVQVVPFESYVESVLAAEFGPTTPVEAMRAGAVAVKDYGWFNAMVWRGRSAPHGGCYDVVDNTWDQIYWPERFRPVERQIQAVRDTWRVSVRKNGSFLATGYRNGMPGTCGGDADGWRLYQLSAYDCARHGMLYPEILRTYYGPGFELVVPGVPDPSGDGRGEIAISVPVAPPTAPAASFYTVVPADPAAPAWQPAGGAEPEAVVRVGQQLADVNGDGRADLVRFDRPGTAGYRLTVALSAGNGAFEAPATWWSATAESGVVPTNASVQLVAGDFDGDGVADVGLFESAPGTAPSAAADGTVMPAVVPEARLYVLRSERSRFAAPAVAWSGPADASRSRAFAADVTGDGRADLVVQAPLYPEDLPGDATPPAAPAVGADDAVLPVGVRFLVAPSSAGGRLGAMGPWLDMPGTTPDEVRTVVADVNRDGRADLVALRPWSDGGSQLVGLISSGTSFGPRVMWSGKSFRWSAAKIAAADVDGDGRGDVVALYDAGAAGTRLYPFLSTGFAFRSGERVTDPAIPWADAVPF